jgi:hypothetical protein
MSNITLGAFALAVAATMLIVAALRHDDRPARADRAPAPAFEAQWTAATNAPVAAKGSRLPGPIDIPQQPPPPAPPPAPVIIAPPPKAVQTQRIIEPLALAVAPKATSAKNAQVDSVCGAKGRTWYTKDNGWKYWRCNR